MRIKTLLLVAVIVIPSAAHASRVKDYSLTECIKKADIIVMGSPQRGSLKAEGDVGHVVPKGRSCVAAMSSDCVLE